WANDVSTSLRNTGLRIEVDDRSESLNRKVREAQLKYIPLIITLGPREKESGTFSVRTLDGKVRHGIDRDVFVKSTTANIQNRSLDLEIFSD
ncbi:MAG: His/Gly/Thr/Pro-type tRNA ligase C-terminal domain-containing protein, partial [Thermodesulfobacteriota bacterium]|nr:His/Gly/Thr/Pro-type tRNA ligase C-terminal domain-containing protein [Thermodesulfobacteriota bacterium]